MSKVLWERIPNVGSKLAREGAKAMSLALALLDFQHGVSEEQPRSLRNMQTCSSSER